MQKSNQKKRLRQPQKQNKPGKESKMVPQPVFDNPAQRGSGKLNGKVAVITGGDSGIGRAVAALFAKEGADVAIIYYNEHEDAKETKHIVEKQYGRKCMIIAANIGKEKHCTSAVKKIIKQFSQVDILVNNAATQFEQKSIKDITEKQLLTTFETNIFSMFYMTKALLDFIPENGAIVNTASVTAYRGSPKLMDYASTKGSIVSFTRSLAASLLDKKIRVNAVAPGPVWTPLIVSSFAPEKVSVFGSDSPMKRAGQPVEIAPCYLFLACGDSSYITGQTLHPNGGEIING